MLGAFEFKERDMIEIHYEMEHFSVQLKVFLRTKFYLWLSTNFSRTDILLHICQFIAHSILMTRWDVWTVAELWLRSSSYDLGCTYMGLVPWAPVALLMNISIFKSLLFTLTIGGFLYGMARGQVLQVSASRKANVAYKRWRLLQLMHIPHLRNSRLIPYFS